MLRLADRHFSDAHPAVMAIINRTPDSFYAANRFQDLEAALEAAGRAVDEGADVIDVGAVRAGEEGEQVPAHLEIARLQPFLEEFRRVHPDVLLSIDTWRSEVFRAVEHHGIALVNDTWAGHDPELVRAAAAAGAGIVCSHSGGLPPRTDPVNATFPPEPDGVFDHVVRTVMRLAGIASDAGIPNESIVLDPTLDFGKTTRHSLVLVRRVGELTSLGYPVMQAISRKDFVGESLDRPVDGRLWGSLSATAVSAWLGVILFRTHDVAATRDVVDMVAMISGAAEPRAAARGVPREVSVPVAGESLRPRPTDR